MSWDDFIRALDDLWTCGSTRDPLGAISEEPPIGYRVRRQQRPVEDPELGSLETPHQSTYVWRSIIHIWMNIDRPTYWGERQVRQATERGSSFRAYQQKCMDSDAKFDITKIVVLACFVFRHHGAFIMLSAVLPGLLIGSTLLSADHTDDDVVDAILFSFIGLFTVLPFLLCLLSYSLYELVQDLASGGFRRVHIKNGTSYDLGKEASSKASLCMVPCMLCVRGQPPIQKTNHTLCTGFCLALASPSPGLTTQSLKAKSIRILCQTYFVGGPPCCDWSSMRGALRFKIFPPGCPIRQWLWRRPGFNRITFTVRMT